MKKASWIIMAKMRTKVITKLREYLVFPSVFFSYLEIC